MIKEGTKPEQIQILHAYRQQKQTKGSIPIMLKVRFKKNEQPKFMPLNWMRDHHPIPLINFLASKINLNASKQQETKKQNEQKKQNEEEYKNMQKCSLKKRQQKQILKDNSKQKNQQINLQIFKDKYNRRSSRSKIQNQKYNEPIRKSQRRKSVKTQQIKMELQNNSQNQQQIQKQIKEKNIKGSILDYDYIIQESNNVCLISPAVIYFSKITKSQIAKTVKINKRLDLIPPKINLNTSNNYYSDQQFLDRDQSQFLLSQKERNRRKKESSQQRQSRQKFLKIKNKICKRT